MFGVWCLIVASQLDKAAASCISSHEVMKAFPGPFPLWPFGGLRRWTGRWRLLCQCSGANLPVKASRGGGKELDYVGTLYTHIQKKRRTKKKEEQEVDRIALLGRALPYRFSRAAVKVLLPTPRVHGAAPPLRQGRRGAPFCCRERRGWRAAGVLEQPRCFLLCVR